VQCKRRVSRKKDSVQTGWGTSERGGGSLSFFFWFPNRVRG